MRIERVTDVAAVLPAADLFDAPPLPAATAKFLDAPGHHLLFAYDETGRAVGMISGVEMTHPDKGTEMFIYELGVAPAARLQGIGASLVAALAGLARTAGCYGMWVGTETGNEAALATYRRAGATDETTFVLLNWDLVSSAEAPVAAISLGGPAGTLRIGTAEAGRMPSRRWLSPMRARSAHEPHRAATPLEAFFDLCFVVAVAAAGAPLHHSIAEHHLAAGSENFLMVFFAIWWAWMNFTWFASAYDTDDDVYRLTTLLQIAGALVLAAGVEPAFDQNSYGVITAGYVIMRLAMVAQWLRAARSDPPRRRVALRYVAGVTVVQVAWLLRLLLPAGWQLPAFLILMVAELAIPIWSERAEGGPTTFHPHHIAERYGLFTLIVLGETVSAATLAVRGALDEGGHETGPLLALAGAGLLIVFALWWVYFDRSAHHLLGTLRSSMLWGYGHYFIFASAAAVGAGLSVAVDQSTGAAEISATVAGYAVAIPVAAYLFVVWLLHVRPHQRGPMLAVFPVTTVLVLLAPLVPDGIKLVAALLVALVAITVTLGRRAPDPIA